MGIPVNPDGWAVKSNNFSGLQIVPVRIRTVFKAFDGYVGKSKSGEVRKADERGLRAVAGGQSALIDVRLKPVEEIIERGEGWNSEFKVQGARFAAC